MSADPPLPARSPYLRGRAEAVPSPRSRGAAWAAGRRTRQVWSAGAAHLAGAPLHPGCSYLRMGKSPPAGGCALAPRGDQAAKQKSRVNGGQTALSCILTRGRSSPGGSPAHSSAPRSSLASMRTSSGVLGSYSPSRRPLPELTPPSQAQRPGGISGLPPSAPGPSLSPHPDHRPSSCSPASPASEGHAQCLGCPHFLRRGGAACPGSVL